MIYIYTLSDELGNTRYVGQTNNPSRRYKGHIRRSVSEKSEEFDTHKSRWIRKLLLRNIFPVMEIIDISNTRDEANDNEDFYIDYLTYLGMKLTNSSCRGVSEFSIETRKKMSDARKGKTLQELYGEEQATILIENFIKRTVLYFTGRPKTQEHKDKISNTLKEFFQDKNNHWAYGMKMSDEHNEKLRQSQLNIDKCKGNTKPKTQEQIYKIRQTLIGSKVTRYKIRQYDLEDNFIKEWDSIRNIKESNQTYNRSSISKCCKGEKSSYAGCIWKYGEIKTSVLRLDKDGNLLEEQKSIYNFTGYNSSTIWKSIKENTLYKECYFIYKV